MSVALEEVIHRNDEVVERIRDLIQGLIIADKRGVPIQTHYDNTTTQGMVNLLGKVLVDMARSAVRDIDPTNNLTFLRVKTRKCEFLIAPEDEFTIIVVQEDDDENIKRTRAYVEEAFRRINEKPGVLDVIVLNAAGNPVKSSMDETTSLQHAGHFELLLLKAKYMVQQLDETDDILSLRVRTKLHETLITPDGKLTFLVIQDPVDKMQQDIVG